MLCGLNIATPETHSFFIYLTSITNFLLGTTFTRKKININTVLLFATDIVSCIYLSIFSRCASRRRRRQARTNFLL